ncbi:hypothetical protein MJG53_013521 [Ovis ammon polii x Ovis aries]|uniref:Uncharacterized protein n=1 Tax=Ovis ammon polii x Ovis aries TaxID=2918886 RepID=A0ACB9UIJ5_9CETA|nr:hypothetical protein MJG53_013521 [Ovis ammon polii x Ovis aries]
MSGRMKQKPDKIVNVSLLSFWTLPTTARLAVETVPPLVAEGSVAVFNILEKKGLIIGYGWFRGNRVEQKAAIEVYQVLENSHTPGPANTGRETIKPNGSLIIQSVRKQDAGSYTVVTVKADLTNVSASGQLQVYSLLRQPSIQVNDSMVRQKGNRVVITCVTNETDISIKWIFNKQQLKAAKNIFLSKDSKNLTIDPIKKENAGEYQCEIFNIGTSNRSEIFELKVKGRENSRALGVGAITGIMIGVLLVLTPLAVLGRLIFLHRPPHLMPGHQFPSTSVTLRGQRIFLMDTGALASDWEETFSLLTFWTPPTTAQPTIETVPPLAAEGSNVLLLAHNVSENPLGYAWHRGERVDNTQLIALYRVDNNATTNGPVYSGRETLYPNGTLLIWNVTQRDTGSYTLLVTKNDLQTEIQTGHLHVHPPVARPSLQASNTTVTEHEGPVVLTCLTDETGVSIRWFFKGQSLLLAERMTLSSDNSTLTIDPVSREDTGDYQCEASNRGSSSRSNPLRLRVTWQENSRALGVGAITGIVIGVLLVLTPLAVLGRFIFLHRPPDLMPGLQLPSTRNYYAPTQTFTVISATKQMWDLSSSRHISLTDCGKELT